MFFDSHRADHQLNELIKNRAFNLKFQMILSSYESYCHTVYPQFPPLQIMGSWFVYSYL